MQFGPESLLPPVVAIILAIATRRVVVPLATGVFTGACLLAYAGNDSWRSGEVMDKVGGWLSYLAGNETTLLDAPTIFVAGIMESVLSSDHLQATTFSLLVGAMVGVLEGGGGMRALIRWFSSKIRSRRGAQTLIAGSGLAIFFDDYANTLLIGGTMRSTADRYRLSREKLAYLVDSTAAPVAGLAVVSTWAATEISYMGDGLALAGIDDSSAAFQMFIQSIPYRFYPWLAIGMVFLIALSGRDFGPMLTAETERLDSEPPEEAVETDDTEADNHHDWLGMAAVLPLLFCLTAVGIVLVITGMQAIEVNELNGGVIRRAGEILGNGNAYLALIVGGGVGLLVAIASHLVLGGCNLRIALLSALKGAGQMLPALVILWFAWALSAMTDGDKLDTGGYLSSILSERLDERVLPTIVFVIAGAIAFSTGTSWGTMAILTPLSIDLALKLDAAGGPDGAIALTTCGAVLAGAIFGDHCSPISDTTVLSSRASGCDHVAHVRTQIPYALVVGVTCIAVGTIPAVLGVSPWISLLAGMIVLAAILRMIGKQAHETNSVERSSIE